VKFGLFGVNMYAAADPDVSVRIARAAEDAGFESLWAGEHVVLPDPQVPPAPMGPQDPAIDPVVALTWLAAATHRVLLASGIIILPQRNPIVLAKQLASLDVLSGGRLVVGIGAGYLEPEMTAIGVPLADRGRRTDEYVAAMRSLWHDEHPAFEGRYASFSGVDAHPRPVQPGGPPIVVGGHSPAAHRRAVATGDGWYGFALDEAATAAQLEGLRRAATEVERPAHLGDLEITVTPRARLDRDVVERFAALGVHRLVVLTGNGLDADGMVAVVERTAPLIDSDAT
jgi:probable F420-dependent oxidoreductase